jgi:hypothetical protein
MNSVRSPAIKSIPLLYAQSLGNGCAQFKSLSLLSHYPPIYDGVFYIKVIYQKIQTIRLHASRCHLLSLLQC